MQGRTDQILGGRSKKSKLTKALKITENTLLLCGFWGEF